MRSIVSAGQGYKRNSRPFWRGREDVRPGMWSRREQDNSLPSIDTGSYRYPISQSAGIAVRAVSEHLELPATCVREVTVCVLFSESNYGVYAKRVEEWVVLSSRARGPTQAKDLPYWGADGPRPATATLGSRTRKRNAL